MSFWDKIRDSLDPANIFHSGDQSVWQNVKDPFDLFSNKGGGPATTPAEVADEQTAAQYINQYNSGKLSAADQATVNMNDVDQTAAVQQMLANNGMLNSSAATALVGNTTMLKGAKGANIGPMSVIGQAAIGGQASDMTQQIMANYLQMGQAYLGLSQGQAKNVQELSYEQQAQIAQQIGSIAKSFASVYGNGGMSPDLAPTNINPGSPNVYPLSQINYTPMQIPNAPDELPPLE